MSTARLRNLSILVGLVLIVGLAVTVRAFTAGGAQRELVLYARGMAFYLPGSDAPNPTLRVTAGETLRLTVVNDDPGVEHDLEVAALDLDIAPLAKSAGSRGSATLKVPERPGRYPYVCTFHAQMMRGTLEVLPAAGG
jgi:plastocyanin